MTTSPREISWPSASGSYGYSGSVARVNRDRHTVLEREAPVTRDVVRVRVRLEHAGDPHLALLGLVEVLLDRVGGIDDHGLTRGLVADQVGRAAEVVVDELPKLHEEEPNSGPGPRRNHQPLVKGPGVLR